mgnify:CR=1 FL=1
MRTVLMSSITIKEGEQFFVNRVIVSGLEHTKRYVVRRELQVKPEAPLSQAGMLESQRRLYDLGIFSEVNTAVQNPNGVEEKKNVLFDLHETKRYTFDYGFGFEFQTGQPDVGSNQPLGQTGVSPRVSFEVTRLNLRGRNQTVTFKTNLSRLQQRVLLNYEAPQWSNKNLRLSFTGFLRQYVGRHHVYIPAPGRVGSAATRSEPRLGWRARLVR